MEYKLKVIDPERIPLKFETTMTLGEWVELKRQLSDTIHEPAYTMRRAIEQMVRTASAHFEFSEDELEDDD